MTREEAIKIIRDNIPHLGIGATKMTEALEALVPELRESEDERIRKKLIDIVDKYRSLILNGGDEIFDKCVAWLENRKEKLKNPNSIPANCASNAKSEDRHDNPGDFVCEHWKPSDEQMDALHAYLGSAPRSPVLYELYEQLDKMRK